VNEEPAVIKHRDRWLARSREGRNSRRRGVAQAKRAIKRSARVAALSFGLATEALKGRISRNEARRRLKAEVVRMYGRFHAGMIQPRLVSVRELRIG
jgi:hypothetical protein